MKRFAKIIFRASLPLLALVALQPVIFASVDDAQSFALQAAEPYVKQGFQVRKSIGRRFPFTFMTRTESLRKNQTDGKKATSRPHT